jgi:molybdate transport system ATP-binding protein
MIEVDIQLEVADGHRRFDAHIAFASAAPVTALYGPSGAGKSLTLQALAGLIRPRQGRIHLAGQCVFDAARQVDTPTPKRRVGYLFQHYALFPHLNVWQNVAFGLGTWRRGLRPAQRDQVQALLEAFGLQDLARSRPATLSGGQQQRVALARALACEPAVLLLDEPFAALNPMLRDELRAELARVVQQWRVPTLMITHDLDDVLALAQVAVRLEAGRVVRMVDVTRGEPLMPERTPRPPHPHAAAVKTLLQGP